MFCQTTKLICPLIADTVQQMRADMAAARAKGADIAECRLDYLACPPSRQDLEFLLDKPPIELIVTNRPARDGGNWRGTEQQRLEILKLAAENWPEYLDIELGVPREQWPSGMIIHSHHDYYGVPDDLEQIAAALDASAAPVNKIAFMANQAEDGFRALDVIRYCHKPTIAIAMGEAGLFSRVLARKFGGFGTFAAMASGAESAPGQMTLEEILGGFRWEQINSETEVYGVIGSPIGHSLSPAVHNAAFAELGLNAVYLPLRVNPGGQNFAAFMDELIKRPWLDWRGLSITIPHKENALRYLGRDHCDALSLKIGAINTITIDPQGRLRGENTDYSGAIDAICQAMGIVREKLAGRKVGILGAGGVGRAVVTSFVRYNAEVTVYNRTVVRAQELAAEFNCRFANLEAIIGGDDEIIINCTPIGMYPDVNGSPIPEIPASARIVFDTIYNPMETQLLSMARQLGCQTVSGVEMFVNQAAAQFESWTHRPAPREVMRKVVVQRLSARLAM